MIRELPQAERPREKLYALGSSALSNTELLAVLIGSGTKAESAIVLAAKILAMTSDGLPWLSTAMPEELADIPGIGCAKASRIVAATELGKRLAAYRKPGKVRLGSPEEIAAIFMEEMRHERKELFKILLLNIRNESMGTSLISTGNLTGAIVDPRAVFMPAIKKGAASIVLVHNHPSGDPTPSDADVNVTERIVEAGKILDIRVLDHLVIGDGVFTSFKRKNLI
jgi:DNA repair protein RadC